MKFLLFITLIFLLNSCKKIWPDDELSIQKQTYTGNVLRIDGYYYYNFTNNYGDNIRIYFLNRNGIILYGSEFLIEELSAHETKYINGEFYNTAKDEKDYWALFEIEENKISFEDWSILNGRYKVYIKNGIILNDTTFKITESYRMHKGKIQSFNSLDQTYHFKQFSPKPDSTNNFID